MTDLTGKFNALETTLVGKLDTVIARLDSLITLLSSSGGSIDVAPIVAAIEALRGIGPENTVKSLNQSIWNMVGPAPGRTLTEIYDLFNPGLGMTPYNIIDLIYNTMHALKTNVGTPTGDATTTILGRLSSVQYALTDNAANAANLFGAIRAINDAIGGTPNSSLEIASVRGLLNALLTDATQFGVLPDGLNATEISSTTTITDAGYRYIVWPDIIGISRSEGNTVLTPNTNWTGYSVFIQTDSPTFIMYDHTDSQMTLTLPSNTWQELSGNHSLSFAVVAMYNAKGFIRPPEVIAPSCFNVSMKSMTLTPPMTRDLVDWTGSPLEQYASATGYVYSSIERTATNGKPILYVPLDTLKNYTFLSTKRMGVGTNMGNTTVNANTVYTVISGVTKLWIDIWWDSGIVVNVCPPGLR